MQAMMTAMGGNQQTFQYTRRQKAIMPAASPQGDSPKGDAAAEEAVIDKSPMDAETTKTPQLALEDKSKPNALLEVARPDPVTPASSSKPAKQDAVLEVAEPDDEFEPDKLHEASCSQAPEVRALPPSLLTAGKSGGARRPESIESAEPTAKRVKPNTAHRSLVLLGHAERFAAQRRWVTGRRRRHRLACQEPSHKKKPWQHKKTAVQGKTTAGPPRIRPWPIAPFCGCIGGCGPLGRHGPVDCEFNTVIQEICCWIFFMGLGKGYRRYCMQVGTPSSAAFSHRGRNQAKGGKLNR